MILEAQVEKKLIDTLSEIDELKDYQFIGSRNITEQGIRNADSDDTLGVIAVSSGFRTHDAFSLSPITLNLAITVMTRVEHDYTSTSHESAIEKLADTLSLWHRVGTVMTTKLTTDKFSVGELRIDGGTGRTFDKANSTFTETIRITVRGSEIFNN